MALSDHTGKIAGGVLALAATLTISQAGIDRIAVREDGRAAKASMVADYHDIGGVGTACGGIVIRKGFTPGKLRTRAECDIMLREAVTAEQKVVQRTINIPVSQRQFDEMVDMVHNPGPGAFAREFAPRANSWDCRRVGNWIKTWRATVKGKPNKGVAARRKLQAEGWMMGCES